MEDFIAMCDAAEELKKCWTPKPGDRYYLKNDLYKVDGGWEGLTVIKNDNLHQKEGIYVISCDCDFGTIEGYDGIIGYDTKLIRKHSIWLPRQGQTQKLLKKLMGRNSTMLIGFKQFTFSYGRPIDKYCMDALWLMYYYFEIHSKIWNGEKFEEVEKNLIGVWS
jgi:hypothetical protein